MKSLILQWTIYSIIMIVLLILSSRTWKTWKGGYFNMEKAPNTFFFFITVIFNLIWGGLFWW